MLLPGISAFIGAGSQDPVVLPCHSSAHSEALETSTLIWDWRVLKESLSSLAAARNLHLNWSKSVTILAYFSLPPAWNLLANSISPEWQAVARVNKSSWQKEDSPFRGSLPLIKPNPPALVWFPSQNVSSLRKMKVWGPYEGSHILHQFIRSKEGGCARAETRVLCPAFEPWGCHIHSFS